MINWKFKKPLKNFHAEFHKKNIFKSSDFNKAVFRIVLKIQNKLTLKLPNILNCVCMMNK